jgi:hypothetical protein
MLPLKYVKEFPTSILFKNDVETKIQKNVIHYYLDNS